MIRGRRWARSDIGIAVVLAGLASAVVVAIAAMPDDVPVNLVFLPLVLGILFLSNRVLRWFAAFITTWNARL